MVLTCGILEPKSMWDSSYVEGSIYSWNLLCKTQHVVFNKKNLETQWQVVNIIFDCVYILLTKNQHV